MNDVGAMLLHFLEEKAEAQRSSNLPKATWVEVVEAGFERRWVGTGPSSASLCCAASQAF